MAPDPADVAPALSVIVTVVGGGECTRRCLAALCPQAQNTGAEIIVPYDKYSLDVEGLVAVFAHVRFVRIDDLGAAATPKVAAHAHRLYDRRRAVGLSLARGRLVAITEDYAVPAADWCHSLVAAQQQSHPVIGGAIECGVDRPLNRAWYYCDFGRYGRPFEPGEREYVSDVNVSYQREALESVRDVWARSYQETSVHWALRARGVRLFLDPRPVVYQHRPAMGLWSALRERVQWGRVFAETRAARTWIGLRLLHALGTPLLPALLKWRAFTHMRRQGQSAGRVLATMPIVSLLCAAWSWGEFLGYLFGQPIIRQPVISAPTTQGDVVSHS